MGTGELTQARLVEYVDRAALACKGDFAEIGVFEGATFHRLARLANARGRTAHAFDSFRGMSEPGEHDNPGYHAGKFDVGGKHGFIDRMAKYGLVYGIDYQAHEGYVPECFKDIPPEHMFAFAYVDLDHHEPTWTTLLWLHNWISPGGIILCDDYFEGDEGASLAIDKYTLMQGHGLQFQILDNNQCVITR
jgi:hypothetical protein